MDAEEIPVVVSQVDPEVEETLVPLKEEIVDENVQLPESASLPNVPQVVQENGEENYHFSIALYGYHRQTTVLLYDA